MRSRPPIRMNRPYVALLALLLAAPLSAFQPPVGHATSSRTQLTVTMAARSKEAEANIKKWGKILSQADTFDDKIKLKKKAGDTPSDNKAGAGIVLAGSAAAALAMIVASVGQ